MPARDAPDARREPEAEGEERAPAGGARTFLQEHGRLVLVVVVGALVAFAALSGTRDHGTDSSDDEPDGEEGPPTGGDALGTVSTVPGSADTAEVDTTTGTTLVPPDVAHERPEVDVETPPAAGDPVEVARWWAAAYVAYVGAEAPGDLAERLTPLTEPAFLQSLRNVAPAASYDAPAPIEGATGIEVAGGAGTKVVRVSVESSAALVVYDVTLVEGPPGSWLVSQAARV